MIDDAIVDAAGRLPVAVDFYFSLSIAIRRDPLRMNIRRYKPLAVSLPALEAMELARESARLSPLPISYQELLFEFQKGGQQLVRFYNVAAAIKATRINDPAGALECHRAAISPGEVRSAELVSDDFPVFHLDANGE